MSIIKWGDGTKWGQTGAKWGGNSNGQPAAQTGGGGGGGAGAEHEYEYDDDYFDEMNAIALEIINAFVMAGVLDD